MNRLPASQRYQRHDRRWKRYEKPLPGHRVQIDVKFIQPLPGADRKNKKYDQFTAIDDSGRTSTTIIGPTAASGARHPTNASARRPAVRPGCNHPPSVAHHTTEIGHV